MGGSEPHSGRPSPARHSWSVGRYPVMSSRTSTAGFGSGRVIRLTGELQTSTVSRARQTLWPSSDLSAPLIVDLGGVSFVDSAGLALLLTVHREITRRGGRW